MNKFYFLTAAMALFGLNALAATVTDVISSETLTLTTAYAEQSVVLPSGANYLLTLKDEGDGPQFKAGGSSIVVSKSPGTVASIEVTWGSKSNENIQVYGSDEPYFASKTAITGTDLGFVPFVANSTSSLTLDGAWKYIGLTSTANLGKACQFVSIAITWNVDDEPAAPDPCEGLVINEVSGDDGTTEGCEDWIEFVNSTDAPISLAGVQVIKVDEKGVPSTLYTYEEGISIAPGEYKLCTKGVEFTDGLSNTKNFTVRLVSPDGNIVTFFNKNADVTANGNHYPGGSYARIPDVTGKWACVANATPGAPNDATPIAPEIATFRRIDNATALQAGMKFILVNEENNYAMASAWGTTKDGAVFQLATEVEITDGLVDVDTRKAAVCELVGNDDNNGTWAIFFGATNNDNNDSRFLACTAFKDLKFKKNDDATKGTRATITFNAGGDAEISYGELAGSIKFNLKDDGTSRFLNYDPADKPEDHLAVCIYALTGEDNAVEALDADSDLPAEYYNLQGVRIAAPTPGSICIVRRGASAGKLRF